MQSRNTGWSHGFAAVLILAAGLVTACATRSAQQRVYYNVRVQQGDTLAGLAIQFDTSWQDIAKHNNLGQPPQIYVDQVLKIYPGPGGLRAGDQSNPAARGKTVESDSSAGLLFGGSADAKPLNWPVRGKITSHFGMRNGRPHNGIDISANRGTPIKTAGIGTITFAGWKRGYGRTVMVKHTRSGLSTLYAHCEKLQARVGREIAKGTVIGFVGRSGNARGYHLHFEVRNREQQPFNPLAKLLRPNWKAQAI